MSTYTIQLEEDPETGELLLPFSPEILKVAGWAEGDILEWTVEENGSITLRKAND
jgi:bifunctional DNA-binding transcriptional regulator/antitoxin component of YhaV-PrlF toxin-antitoxin module